MVYCIITLLYFYFLIHVIAAIIYKWCWYFLHKWQFLLVYKNIFSIVCCRNRTMEKRNYQSQFIISCCGKCSGCCSEVTWACCYRSSIPVVKPSITKSSTVLSIIEEALISFEMEVFNLRPTPFLHCITCCSCRMKRLKILYWIKCHCTAMLRPSPLILCIVFGTPSLS